MKSQAIWKYSLKLGHNEVEMPQGAPVVHVSAKEGVVTVWAIVAPDSKYEMRHFEVVGTGHPLPEHWHYLGTAHIYPYVWHVLEVRASRIVNEIPLMKEIEQ